MVVNPRVPAPHDRRALFEPGGAIRSDQVSGALGRWGHDGNLVSGVGLFILCRSTDRRDCGATRDGSHTGPGRCAGGLHRAVRAVADDRTRWRRGAHCVVTDLEAADARRALNQADGELASAASVAAQMGEISEPADQSYMMS